jgi:hypothetical protein
MSATMNTMFALAEQIENSGIGIAIAESRFAYPVIEGIHLIGLSVSVGLIFITDLRLMGLVLTRVPVDRVLNHLRPYVLGGFAAIFVSGGLLFWSSALRMLESPAFLFKMLFIALAGINAIVFERGVVPRHAVAINPRAGSPDDSSLVTSLAKLPRSFGYAGLASLTLWTLTIICGRLIPYLPAWS